MLYLVLGSEKAEVEAAVALPLAAGFPIPRCISSLRPSQRMGRQLSGGAPLLAFLLFLPASLSFFPSLTELEV